MTRLLCLSLATVLLASGSLTAADGPWEVSEIDGGHRISLDGKHVADYRTDLSNKPIVWPILAENGAHLTRAYPLAERPGEQKDHPHHTGMWFSQEGVGGGNFWHAGKAKQVHQEYLEVSGGDRVTIVTRNDWIDEQGEKVAEDVRRLVFLSLGQLRAIDFDLVLTATERDIKIDDSKEGTFAIRVPSTMFVDRKDGPGGTILNSERQKDNAAWGKPARWVSYFGEVTLPDDSTDTAGITIMNHPSSFRFPTHWHVRTYGLFAANPFGLKDFRVQPPQDGTTELEKGESLNFNYRVVFHRGTPQEAAIQQLYQRYANDRRDVLPGTSGE